MYQRMMSWLVVVGISSLAGLGSVQCDETNVCLFDMGAADSAVWSGFAQVTPDTSYSPERGYGWLNQPSEMRAYVANNVDALAVDDVSGVRNSPISFQVDLPTGDYAVWVLSGAMGNIWRLRYLRAPHELLLQGNAVHSVAHPEEELFRCANYDWRKGDDIYEKFIAPRFVWIRSQASVTDGKLVIGFRPGTDFPVNAIVVAGEGVSGRVQEKLDEVDEQRRAAFYQYWHEVNPETEPPAEVSAQERQRGYLLAEVHCSDDVHPWSQPSAGASRERVEFFATPGEQEQASFAVYALRDLEDVQFEVTALRTQDGKTLPAEAMRSGLVQFIPWEAGAQQYSLRECLILPLAPTFVGEGTCKRFWLTLEIPQDAAPGLYEGRIQISAANAPPSEMQLRIRVVPIRLETPPFERYMYFGTMYYLARAYLPQFDEERFWSSLRAEVRFMRDNQHCRAQCIIPHGREYLTMQDGKVTDVDMSDTERLMQIIREEDAWPRDNTMICQAGSLNLKFGGHFSRPDNPTVEFIPTEEGRENFKRAITIIDQKAKKARWPEIAFEVLGEFTNYRDAGAKFAVEVHSIFKELGVSNTLRGNGASDMAAIEQGLVLYPQPNWAMMRTEWLDFMKKTSKRLWAYNFARSRFAMGWFCFKHGITRASYESGVYANGQPGNLFDIDSMFPMGLPTSMDKIEPTVWLKRLVQGAVDYEYLYNLDQHIKEAEKSGKPAAVQAAKEARAWLDAKLGELPNAVDYMVGDPRVDRDVQGRFWPVYDLDRYRWQMAEFIMAIDRALGRGQ